MYNSKFMEEACGEALISINYHTGGPFGCVIVKDNEIVGRGHNKVLVDRNPTSHGEINAIHTACLRLNTYDLTGCDLYTTAEPCGMCLYACMWANIRNIYYGCSTSDTEQIGFRDNMFDNLTHLDREDLKYGQRKYLEQHDRDMCWEVFQTYFNSNHTIY